MRKFLDLQEQDQRRVSRFGAVRPEIAADFHGQKVVAVGNKIFYRPADRCKFFGDFLLAYVPTLFGRQWFEGEVAKPPDDRHPVMQWRVEGMNYMNKQPKLPDGTYAAVPTGFLLAYLTFAYDLYVVEHNARLDERLLARLKHPDQFQGARHELFSEATCLRAGFSIEHENEKDPTRRHAEFTATHRQTGQKISVEAKSKHRPGVLGHAGAREPVDDLNLRFGKLLNDAVAKNAPHPLVVFLDMNLPVEAADRLLSQSPPHPQILALLDRLRHKHGGKDPVNLVVFTNHPQHYAKKEEIAPRNHVLTVLSTIPLQPVSRPDALAFLHQAANIYGNIPEFPDAPREAPNARPQTG
jgi:hypothetical protein